MQRISNRPFFVYGTLLPGQPNAFLWADVVVAQERAVLKNGRLYDLGHYPMLIEEGEAAVLTVKDEAYADIMARLDHLEGYDPAQHDDCAYRRVAREVWLADGRSLTAWVYIGQLRYVAGVAPLEEGDWVAYAAAVKKQSSAWWAEIKTVSGLLD